MRANKIDTAQLKTDVTGLKDDTTQLKADTQAIKNATCFENQTGYQCTNHHHQGARSGDSAAAAAQSARDAANTVSGGVLDDGISTTAANHPSKLDTAISNLNTQINNTLNAATALIYAGL